MPEEVLDLISSSLICFNYLGLFLLSLTFFYFCIFQLFRDAIKAAMKYKSNPTDIMDEIMQELEVNIYIETIIYSAS